jgi:hypothetical protein
LLQIETANPTNHPPTGHHPLIEPLGEICGHQELMSRGKPGAGLEISVCHFPPGTSKWNTIEHKLFSFISINGKGRPLTSYEL